MKTPLAVLTFASLILSACGSAKPIDPRYPPRSEGCAVQMFPGVPSQSTDNLGPVQAMCDESISDEECTRTLKDEVCKLGGDVAWGVQTDRHSGKKRWSARAAHTKSAP